jgi:hypothetical protein
MSISSVGSVSSTQSSLLSSSPNAKVLASKIVKELDKNKDGSLDQTEFVSGMVAKGMSKDDATKLFSSIDIKKTDKVTASDLESAIQSGKLPKQQGGPAKVGGAGKAGAPPHGGGGGGGPGGAKGSSDSDDTKYDAADINKNGVVEAAEEIAYEQKHPQAAEKKIAITTPTLTTTSSSQSLGSNVDKWV